MGSHRVQYALAAASATVTLSMTATLPALASEDDVVATTAVAAEELYGCDRTIGKPPRGELHKVTEPPDGSSVAPGDVIRVRITWDISDWHEAKLHKVLDCVAIDGRLVPELQGGESPTDNDGAFVHEFTVPADVPDGAEVCDQAMLSGPGPDGPFDRVISDMICVTVASPPADRDRGERPKPPAAPEAPTPPPAPPAAPPEAPPPPPGPEIAPEDLGHGEPPRVAREVEEPAPEIAAPAADVPPPAAAPLPRTGRDPRSLLALAGALLSLGGFGVIGSAAGVARPGGSQR